MSDKLPMCIGCRADFYNGKNDLGVTECWHLKTAKVVTRYRLGWWTSPDTSGSFTKIRTLDCHHAPGQYALYKKLPAFARDVRAA